MAWLLPLAATVDGLHGQEDGDAVFRQVLQLAGLGPEKIESHFQETELKEVDWQLLSQLLARLEQYSAEQLAGWTSPEADELAIGNLYQMKGKIAAVEQLELPAELLPLFKQAKLYRCRLLGEDGQRERLVLSPHVPKAWRERDLSSGERVRFLGIMLANSGGEKQDRVVLLTNHLAWFPERDVSAGKRLLSRHGMGHCVARRSGASATVCQTDGESGKRCLLFLFDNGGED